MDAGGLRRQGRVERFRDPVLGRFLYTTLGVSGGRDVMHVV